MITTPAAVETLETRRLLSADNLVMTVQPPATVTAGATFGLTVTAENSSTNATDTSFTGPITVQDYYGETLAGTTTVNAVAGVANFSGLSETVATSLYLEATSSGQNTGYANAYTDVTPAVAKALSIQTPSNVVQNSVFNVTVNLLDQYGNDEVTGTNNVTLALSNNPTGATLGGTLTVAAVDGIATFSDATLNKIGTGYKLTATSSGLTSSTTDPFDVDDQIVVTTQPPATVTAGATFSVSAKVEDGNGVVQTGYSGAVTISNSYGGALGGTTTVNAVNGVATFTGLSLTDATSYYSNSLQLSGTGLQNADTNDIQVNPAAAKQLSISDPSGVLQNSQFTVTVNLLDQYGNDEVSGTNNVTLALSNNPTGATLGGTLTVAAVGGVATFSNMTLNKIGTGYKLTATSSGLTSSTTDPFVVDDQIVVTTQPPATVTAGATFSVTAKVEDGNGVVQTGYSGAVTISNPYGGTLGGTTTVNAVNGVATFTGLSLTNAYPYYSNSLQLSGTGLQNGSTNDIQVNPAAVKQLSISDPFGVVQNSQFQVTVNLQDQYGNDETSGTNNVTLALSNNPAGATLGGTLTVAAVGGVATFSNVTLNKIGTGYALTATSSGLASSTTDPFEVDDQIVVTTQPPATVTAGATFSVTAKVEDGNGVVQTGYSGAVTISNPYGPLSGTTTVNVVNGVATFTGLSLTQATGYDTLSLSGTELATASTNSIQVNPAAVKQAVIQQISNQLLNEQFTATVRLEDIYGNSEGTGSNSVTIALGANPGGATLGGTLTVAAVNGVATFSGLSINQLGTGYTLTASSSGLTSSTSDQFNVNDQIVVTTEPPASVTAGAAFTVVAKVEDGNGVVQTGYIGELTISDPYGGTVNGTTTVNVASGVATFSGLTITQATLSYESDALQIVGAGLPSAPVNAMQVNPAAAKQLSISTPSVALLNGQFSVTVTLKDQYGNAETTGSNNVTIALQSNPGAATLGGTLTVAAVNGVAAFSNLTLNQLGTGYTLTATSSGLTSITTQPFNVEDQIVVTSQPTTVTAGSPFTVVAKVEDGNGVVQTGVTGTLGIANPYGGPLDGTPTATLSSGVATFTGLSLTESTNQYSPDVLQVGGLNLQTGLTNSIQVNAAAATQLSIDGPFSALLNGQFSASVTLEDQYGNAETTGTNNVTVALGTNPGGATLGGTLTVAAVNGVATFSGLTLNKVGIGYTLVATSSGLASSTSSEFDVDGQIVVTSQPTSVTAGSGFTVVAKVEDANGVVQTGVTGALTISNPAGGPLGGTLIANLSSGVATFSGLTLTQATSQYSGDDLEINGFNMQTGDTNEIQVVAAAAAQLAFTSTPSVLLNGKFSVSVTVEDVYGNPTAGTNSVTIALGANPSAATLGGTLTVAAVNGVATFSGLSINNLGTGYILTATSSGLNSTTSLSFNVTDQIVLTTLPPSTVTAGAAFTVVAKVEDGNGVVQTGYSGTLAIQNAVSNLENPAGTTVVSVTNGVATFSGLTFTKVNPIYYQQNQLEVYGAGLPAVQTGGITVTPGAARQLLITSPVDSNISLVLNAKFGVTVTLLDAYGNPLTTGTNTISIGMGANPSGATLSGIVTANAVNGVATFTNLSLNKIGAGYTLIAVASGLGTFASTPFSVSPQVVVTTQPPVNVTAGSAFTVVAKVEDANGVVQTGYTGPLTISNGYYGGGLTGTTTVNAVSGVATFTGLTLTQSTLNQSYSEDSLQITGNGVNTGMTSQFSVIPAAATQLQIFSSVSNILLNGKFNVTAFLEDAYGNTTDQGTNSVTIALGNPGGATLGGTLTVAAVNGQVTFTNLTINQLGAGYTLTVTSSGLTSYTTSLFDVGDQLVITTPPPAIVTAGTPFGLVAKVEDGNGVVQTSYSGSLTVLEGDFAQVGGTTTVAVASGVATFSNLVLNTAGNGSLQVIGGGMSAATAPEMQVVAAAAANNITVSPPSVVTPNSSFTVTATVNDAFGNPSSYNGLVTIALANNPAGATLTGTLSVYAVDGVATFTSLSLNKAGAGYTFKVTASGLTSVVSPSVNAEYQIVITTPPPGSIKAQVAFTVVASVEDGFGTVQTSYNGPMTLYTSNAYSNNQYYSLEEVSTVNAVNGVATFTFLRLSQAPGSVDLTLVGNGLQSATAQAMQVTPAAIAKLSFEQFSNPILLNSHFSVTVEALDSLGNLVTTYTGYVTLALGNNPGGATLGGTVTVPVINGVATFSNLLLNQLGQGYTLKATFGSLSVTSSAFDVADQLILTGQSANPVTAGKSFGLTLRVVDGNGVLQTSYNGAVTISDLYGTSGLSGPTTVVAVNGIASFVGLGLTKSGTVYLQAAAVGIPVQPTFTLNVVGATATKLVMSPVNTPIVNQSFSFYVYAEDVYGNTVSSFTGPVTLQFAANPGSATLGGTLTVNAVGGVATFTNLSINKPGSGYEFSATSSGLTTATTPKFNVTYQLIVTTTPPTSLIAGATFGFAVAVEDGLGNVQTSYSGPVSVYSAQGTSGLEGTQTVNAVNGVATFSGLSLTEQGFNSLAVIGNGLGQTFIAEVDVTPSAPPTHLELSTVSGGLYLNATVSNYTVQVLDNYGNVDPNFNGLVTLALGANPTGATLTGTLSVYAVDGLATFYGLKINKVGVGYTLTATSAGLTSGISSSFNVTYQAVFTSVPTTSVVAGSTFGATVSIEDGLGTVQTSFTGPVTVSGFGLASSMTVNAVSGVATFTGLSATTERSTSYLNAAGSNIRESTSNYFEVLPSTATTLSVSVPSGNIAPGTPFIDTVKVVDTYGNVVTSFNGSVTIALGSNPGSSTLGGTLTVNAFAGVASFSGLTISNAGSGYNLQASSSGLTTGTSITFNVGNLLVVKTQPPASMVAGTSFGLVVNVVNGSGVVQTTFNGPVSIALTDGSTTGELLGTLTVNAVNGVATFSGLKITQSGNFKFSVTAGGLGSTTTANMNVVAGAATQLVLAVPSGDVLTATPFQYTAVAEDVYGNVDLNFTGLVTLALANNPAAATLGGTLTAYAMNGTATFQSVTLSANGFAETLQATSPGLITGVSPVFSVTNTELGIVNSIPSVFTAGETFSVVVDLFSPTGALQTWFNSPVTISAIDFDGNPTTTLGGTLTVTAVNGVATFTGLYFKTTGDYQLLVTSSGVGEVTSDNVFVNPGAATKLLLNNPGIILAGQQFTYSVSAVDANGNIDNTYNGKITLALGANPTSDTLGGTLTVIAVNGFATFTGLTLGNAATGDTLKATATGLTTGTSPAFNVVTQTLVVTNSPISAVTAGSGFTVQMSVENALGVVQTSFNGSVTVSAVNANTGAAVSMGGTLTVTAVNGVATFSGLTLTTATTYILNFTAAGVGPGSLYLTIQPGSATQIVVSAPAVSTVYANTPFVITASIEDGFGNVVPVTGGTATLSIASEPGTGTLAGTLSLMVVNGQAVFSGISISASGTGYKLKATYGGLTVVFSPAFNVT